MLELCLCSFILGNFILKSLSISAVVSVQPLSDTIISMLFSNPFKLIRRLSKHSRRYSARLYVEMQIDNSGFSDNKVIILSPFNNMVNFS